MEFNKEILSDLYRADGGNYIIGSLTEGYDFCKKIALGHYENFPVGSALIPRNEQPHIYAIYAFARLADDVADENHIGDKSEKINYLNKMADYVVYPAAKIKGHPIFIPLRNTMTAKSIPSELPLRLLEAFRRDVNFVQPETIDDIYEYCHYSANPVGEMLLRIFDVADESNIELSDEICTALQMVNFWQDISVDFKSERVYIPRKLLDKAGLNCKNFISSENSDSLYSCLRELYEITEEKFARGKKLIPRLRPYRLKLEIAATVEGGLTILKKCRELKGDIARIRPHINKFEMLTILLKALL